MRERVTGGMSGGAEVHAARYMMGREKNEIAALHRCRAWHLTAAAHAEVTMQHGVRTKAVWLHVAGVTWLQGITACTRHANNQMRLATHKQDQRHAACNVPVVLSCPR